MASTCFQYGSDYNFVCLTRSGTNLLDTGEDLFQDVLDLGHLVSKGCQSISQRQEFIVPLLRFLPECRQSGRCWPDRFIRYLLDLLSLQVGQCLRVLLDGGLETLYLSPESTDQFFSEKEKALAGDFCRSRPE